MRGGYTLRELVVGLVLVSLICSMCARWRPRHCFPGARAGKAKTLVRQIETAAEQYEREHGVYPPGDGKGSEAAQAALGASCPWINPIDGQDPINLLSPGRRNSGRVDIWCTDADGRPDGINNWGG